MYDTTVHCLTLHGGIVSYYTYWNKAWLDFTLTPLQSFGGKELFPTDLEKIARIGFGLAANHAFLDGNKRIGAMVVQLLLKWNGYALHLQQGELADMFIAIADGSAKEEDLLRWIKQHLYNNF